MFTNEKSRAASETAKEGVLELKTRGASQTLQVGRTLGRMLHEGTVIALTGDLGAGKTVLVKGIAEGLGIRDEREVTSPTFVLINEYSGRLPIYHVDLYRLEEPGEVEELGWEEFAFGSGVALVEWAEKISSKLPAERIEVRIQWLGEEERKMTFSGRGRAAQEMVERLGKEWVKEE
jgi:tRNA threonylcarbamoyladenosine biosynthesis protein TsaE